LYQRLNSSVSNTQAPILPTRRDAISRCRIWGSNGDSHASISDLSSTVVLLTVVLLKELVLKDLSLLLKQLSLLLKEPLVWKELSALVGEFSVLEARNISQFLPR